jgi:hypothetical protein
VPLTSLHAGFEMLMISYLANLVIVIIYSNIYPNLLEIKHTTDPERSALWGLIFDNLLTSIYQWYICLFEPRGVLETTL